MLIFSIVPKRGANGEGIIKYILIINILTYVPIATNGNCLMEINCKRI